MTVTLSTPTPDQLDAAVGALRAWQDDAAPMQLHPGDVGWFWRFGAEATAAAVRTWSRDGRVLAVGLLDGPGLVRMTMAPDALDDEQLARQVAADVVAPGRGVLPAGEANVEAPATALLQAVLAEEGWTSDEPWQPLRRDLGDAVPDPGLRIEVVGPDRADACAEVLRASFDRSTFSADRWRAMASGAPYDDARTLLAYDDHGDAVATTTVWSAGPGKPGLIEPLGVHRDHRGQRHGTAITLAACAALRDLGSSSVIVCTPAANVGGVAAYVSAGLERLPEVHDRVRPA